MIGDKLLLKEEHREKARKIISLLKNVKGKVISIGGCSGTGKCLDPNTPIMLYSGEVIKCKDIKPGMFLMSNTTEPVEVDTISSGYSEMYKISQLYGDDYIVNNEHILTLYSGYKKTLIDVPIKEAIAFKGNSRNTQLKGIKSGVESFGRDYNVDLDPYFLGLWLGDGRSRFQSITNIDKEVIDYIYDYAIKIGMQVSIYGGKTRTKEYSIVNKKKGGKKNFIVDELRNLNLILNKHIPVLYKYNNREVRLQILAGLLDTDGSLDKPTTFEITSKYIQLANDILFVARSLGFRAKINKKICNQYPDNEYYRVTISGETKIIPTRIKRKQASKRNICKNPLGCGITITPIGNGEYCGFSLKGKNKRFLLGDFTITHNTEIAVVLRSMFAKKKIRSIVIHLDDYYNTPWKNRNHIRKETGVIGLNEIDWKYLEWGIYSFKKEKEVIPILVINKFTGGTEYREVKPYDVDVIIIEGIYACKLGDIKIKIKGHYKDTVDFRKERKKEAQNVFRNIVLQAEQDCLDKLDSDYQI